MSIGGALLGAVAGPVIGSLLGSGSSSGAQQAAQVASPFTGQNQQYQQPLSQLIMGGVPGYGQTFNYSTTGPNANPAYLNALQTGLQSVDRGMASTGQSGSGNNQAQLQQVGQNLANQNYNSQYQQWLSQQTLGQSQYSTQAQLLAGLSGANVNPGTAGNILGTNAQQTSAGLGQIGNNIGTALGNYVGGSSPTTDFTNSIGTNSGFNYGSLNSNVNTGLPASGGLGSGYTGLGGGYSSPLFSSVTGGT